MSKVSNHILLRVYVLFGLFLLFSGLIVVRVLAIQWNKDKWLKKEIEEQVFFKKSVADRGNILAEDGTIMATSLPFYRIAMDPTKLDTISFENFEDSLIQLAINLTNYFDDEETRDTMLYYDRVKSAIERNDKHIYLVRKKLNFKELEMVKQWPILKNHPYEGGLVSEKFNNERFYPFGDLARITLGRLKDDTLGIRGIEHSFNRELRGRDGYVLAQKVVGNSYVPLDDFGDDGSRDGLDVVTTLDVDIQDVVEKALREGVERNFAKHGTAILIEVETGEIKAIANYPENYNYAVAMQEEPGSTFKTAAAAALIEDDLVDICDTVNTGRGKILFDDKEITDNGHAFGEIPMMEVFAQSSNVGMAMFTSEHYQTNPERFIWRLETFGFSQIVNRQIVGEPSPKIIRPEDEDWTIATLPSLSYGYSVSVTPLQMATFYNGIANKGKLMRPWIVKEVKDNSRTIRSFSPEVINPKMVSEETSIKLREMMKAVVDHGTAQRAFRKMPFEVAGKTGTVRKNVNGRYIKKYRASFGGFFPADAPEYTLYVMVDEPDGGYASGGKVAAPIFRKIAEKVYSMDMEFASPKEKKNAKPSRKPANGVIFANSAKEVYPELGIQTSDIPEGEWLSAESNGHQVNLSMLNTDEMRIPNLKGMTSRDAINLCEKLGVKVKLQGFGRVRRQSLLPGYKVGDDTSITLFLG